MLPKKFTLSEARKTCPSDIHPAIFNKFMDLLYKVHYEAGRGYRGRAMIADTNLSNDRIYFDQISTLTTRHNLAVANKMYGPTVFQVIVVVKRSTFNQVCVSMKRAV
jgi:hypothetical protein